MLIVELLLFSHQFQFAWFMDSDSILPYALAPACCSPSFFWGGGASGGFYLEIKQEERAPSLCQEGTREPPPHPVFSVPFSMADQRLGFPRTGLGSATFPSLWWHHFVMVHGNPHLYWGPRVALSLTPLKRSKGNFAITWLIPKNSLTSTECQLCTRPYARNLTYELGIVSVLNEFILSEFKDT